MIIEKTFGCIYADMNVNGCFRLAVMTSISLTSSMLTPASYIWVAKV